MALHLRVLRDTAQELHPLHSPKLQEEKEKKEEGRRKRSPMACIAHLIP